MVFSFSAASAPSVRRLGSGPGARDLGQELSIGRFAAEKLVNHLRRLLLASLRQYRAPEAAPDRGVPQVISIHRQHIEREHFRPHVTVVARGIAADDVLEVAWKLGARNVTQRSLAFHRIP